MKKRQPILAIPKLKDEPEPTWVLSFIEDTNRRTEWPHWEKVCLVDRLGAHNFFRPHLVDQANEAVRQALGVTTDRLKGILALEKKEEISRALHWEAPFGHFRLPGEEHFPRTGWLGRYLLYCQDSEAPLGWHFWCAVATLGAAARRNFWFNFRDYIVYLNHFLLLVGPSGQGKNLSISRVMDLLGRTNRRLEAANIPSDLRINLFPEMGTPERFIERLSTKEVPNLDPFSRRLHPTRRTEAVCVLANEEVSTLLGKESHRGGGQWVKLITAISDGKDWHNTTVGRGDETLISPTLTFIGGSTADWLKYSVSEEMFSGGFMSRCVLIPRDDVRRKAAYPGVRDPVTANQLSEYLAFLAQHHPYEMSSDPEADESFQAWWDHTSPTIGQDPALIGWESRKKVHVWRLACVLALSEERYRVTRGDWFKALELIDYEERFLPEILSELSDSRDVETVNKVYNFIRNRGGWIKRTDILRSCYRVCGSADKLSSILATLKEAKMIDMRKGRDAGREVSYFREHQKE